MSGELYTGLNGFLHGRFGERVYRVSVDAGFTCPNRDGTKGRGGCAYCNESGSRAAYVEPKVPVAEQLRRGKEIIARMYGVRKFIAYFQPYSNTYGVPVETLEHLYRSALEEPDIAGIAIGTRPDAVSPAIIELLADIARERLVILEYGAQSMRDDVLERITRGHTAADTEAAFGMSRGKGIHLAAHLIFGLPGETPDDMIAGAIRLVELGADGFKFHHLYIEKNTRAERMYAAGEIGVLSRDEYIEILCGVIPRLPERIVLHRLFGQCAPETLAAPEWTLDKNGNLDLLRKVLRERGIRQGMNV
ncbi:MAG: TIGR01212 family radical SAM protein [Spirochaetes bacterium GWF1_49_6]|nr:MAG: TIGR01212 family radical SAM protein [Spirochaetes bacterium GWF1_49_6]